MDVNLEQLNDASPGLTVASAALAAAADAHAAMAPLELAGHVAVAVWAFGATIAAGRAQMDAVGSLVTAFFATLGGSTLRDVILMRRVFWVEDSSYLATLVATRLATFALYPWLARRARFEERKHARTMLLLEVPDAIGMAFYSVYGAYVPLHCCDEANGPLVAVLMGLCTSTYGGLVADPLCGRPIRILQAGETLVALPALLGASVYAAWDAVHPGGDAAAGMYVAATLAFVLRMAAVCYDLKLPVWRARKEAADRKEHRSDAFFEHARSLV